MSERYILGLESSCDETSVALVDRRGYILVNVVASQIELHRHFGGVVPEVAARRHIETFLPMIETAFAEASAVAGRTIGWDDVEAIGVTYAPGLIGCLLIGVETAKALAWRYGKPLIAVHHLKAHLHAPFLHPGGAGAHLLIEGGRDLKALPFDIDAEGVRRSALQADVGLQSRPTNTNTQKEKDFFIGQPEFPHVGLIVSGGHTSLALVEAPGRCTTIASTRDDAVGEAYDKVARILGLGFPGGPAIDKLAAIGDPRRFPFTAPMMRRDAPDFSFSGLKSAVARKVEELKSGGGKSNGSAADGAGVRARDSLLDEVAVRDICASFQSAAIEAILAKSVAAARSRGVRDLLIVGGVASNRGLRAAARAAAGPLRVWFPHFSLCTDNAAMIAGLAWHLAPLGAEAALELNPVAVAGLD